MGLNLVALLCVGALHLTSAAASISSLLNQEDRPDIMEVSKIPEKEWIEFYGSGALTADGKTEKVFPLVRALQQILSSSYSGQDIYILGRDGEPIFDALRVSAKSSAQRERIHLIQISRKVVQTTNAAQILGYLKHHGFDLPSITSGHQSAVFIDTGYSGTIYRSLLSTFTARLKQAGVDGAGLRNFFSNVDFRLIASENSENPSFDTLKEKVVTNGPNYAWSLVQSANVSGLSFGTIPSGSWRSKAGLPSDNHSSWQWVVTNLEYTAKWMGRCQSVTASGVENFMPDGKDHQYLDRKAYLKRMATIVAEFSAFQKPIEKVTPIKAALTPLDAEQLVGQDLGPGDLIKADSQVFSVVKELESTDDARYFLINEVKTDKARVLKVMADGADPEVIAVDVRNARRFKKFNVPHSRVVAHGESYLIRSHVEGTLARDWVKSWIKAGEPQSNSALKALRVLIKDLASQGVYIGNLNLNGTVWSGSEWVVIESGKVRTGKASAEVMADYVENINRRWLKHSKCEKLLELKEAA